MKRNSCRYGQNGHETGRKMGRPPSPPSPLTLVSGASEWASGRANDPVLYASIHSLSTHSALALSGLIMIHQLLHPKQDQYWLFDASGMRLREGITDLQTDAHWFKHEFLRWHYPLLVSSDEESRVLFSTGMWQIGSDINKIFYRWIFFQMRSKWF